MHSTLAAALLLYAAGMVQADYGYGGYGDNDVLWYSSDDATSAFEAGFDGALFTTIFVQYGLAFCLSYGFMVWMQWYYTGVEIRPKRLMWYCLE